MSTPSRILSLLFCMIFYIPNALANMNFNAGEHRALGNEVLLHWQMNDNPEPGSTIILENGLQLKLGDIMAIGGDFYGLPDLPITDGKSFALQKERFILAFQTLATSSDAVTEVPTILKTISEEQQRIADAMQQGISEADAYDQLNDEFNQEYNKITGGDTIASLLGRYTLLALTDWDHFGASAISTYSAGHAVALDTAIQAYKVSDPTTRTKLLNLAYAQDAFACHYLTDLFSSGHLRDPRKQLHNQVIPDLVGDVLSKYMHDEDGRTGLWVNNKRGEIWQAFGDGYLFMSKDQITRKHALQALQASFDEVWQTSTSGQLPSEYQALTITPDLNGATLNDPKLNHAALFKWDEKNRVLLRRTNTNQYDDFTYTNSWTGLITLGELMTANGSANVSNSKVTALQAVFH